MFKYKLSTYFSIMAVLDKLRGALSGRFTQDVPEEFDDDYIEIDPEASRGIKSKVQIRPFVIEDFTDIKPILDSLRAGYTVGLINIKAIKDKDLIELKRVINKLKKTCDAIEGDIAGFGEDWIVVCPSFAKVYREASRRFDDRTREE